MPEMTADVYNHVPAGKRVPYRGSWFKQQPMTRASYDLGMDFLAKRTGFFRKGVL